MTGRPIQRRPYRRSVTALGCGCAGVMAVCAVIGVIGAVLLMPVASELALRIAGFESQGTTDEVFNAPAPAPQINIQNAVAPPQVSINAGQYGRFNVETSGVNVSLGEEPNGSSVVVTSFTEADLLRLCQQRTTICGGGDGRYRNATIDLRPGGAVINADVFIPQIGIWQRAGIVMRLNSQTAQFEVIGVDVNGALYTTPPGQLSASVDEIERVGNDVLRQVVVEVGGETLDLAEIYADETTLTLVMR